MSEAQILLCTMTDRAAITREVWNGARWETEKVYDNLACALSRAVQSSTPKLTGQWEALPETEGRLSLFLPKDTQLKAGDRAEITRQGQVFRGVCSASLPYPSHALAIIHLQEVEQA